MTKKTFIKNLKDAPYSDQLIQAWMDYFTGNQLVEVVEATQVAQAEWDKYKHFADPLEFIDQLIGFYTADGVPRVMVYPIFLNMSRDIRSKFITSQALDQLTKMCEGTFDVFEIH
jgi:hypothetical protein